MNIGLLTQYYKPEMGAPQNRLYEMLSGLKALGNQVCVVTGMPNYPTGEIFKEYKGKISLKETVDDIDIKRYRDIATIMGISEEQVKVNIFRARQTIKKEFLKQERYGL